MTAQSNHPALTTDVALLSVGTDGQLNYRHLFEYKAHDGSTRDIVIPARTREEAERLFEDLKANGKWYGRLASDGRTGQADQ